MDYLQEKISLLKEEIVTLIKRRKDDPSVTSDQIDACIDQLKIYEERKQDLEKQQSRTY